MESANLPGAGIGVEFDWEPRKDGFDLPIPNSRAGFTVSELFYADDLCILSTSTDKLNDAIGRIQRVGGPLGLNINPEKSKVLWLSGQPQTPGEVLVGKVPLETVSNFSYLGSVISDASGGSVIRPAILRNVAKARIVLGTLTPLLARKKVSVRAKVAVVRAYMVPTMLYGCESWSTTAKDLEPIDALLSRARRLIVRRGCLGASTWRGQRDDRRSSVLPETARSLIARRRLGFVTQLLANGECELARSLLAARIPASQAKRIGGKCSNHFLRVVMTDFAWLTGVSDRAEFEAWLGAARDHRELLDNQWPRAFHIPEVWHNFQNRIKGRKLAAWIRWGIKSKLRGGWKGRCNLKVGLLGKRTYPFQVDILCKVFVLIKV